VVGETRTQRSLLVEPLTAGRFEPFGQVLSAAQMEGAASANQGTAARKNHSATLFSGRSGASPNLALFRAEPQPFPFEVRLLERHPHSTQCFLPLACARYLICVAPTKADGWPELAGLRAFFGAPGQAINYLPGVWHHPIVALDAPADFAMLAFEDGSAGDCELWTLPEPVLLVGV
jgi:ureidoglycolate lyase